MKRTSLKRDTPIFVERYKGWDIYKQYPSRQYGYDPAPVIYYTAAKTGKRKYEHFAYTLSDIKSQIGNRSDRVKLRRR